MSTITNCNVCWRATMYTLVERFAIHILFKINNYTYVKMPRPRIMEYNKLDIFYLKLNLDASTEISSISTPFNISLFPFFQNMNGFSYYIKEWKIIRMYIIFILKNAPRNNQHLQFDMLWSCVYHKTVQISGVAIWHESSLYLFQIEMNQDTADVLAWNNLSDTSAHQHQLDCMRLSVQIGKITFQIYARRSTQE